MPAPDSVALVTAVALLIVAVIFVALVLIIR